MTSKSRRSSARCDFCPLCSCLPLPSPLLPLSHTASRPSVCMQVVADGKATYANQGKAKVGTVLYRVVWKDFPPDLVWYEPEDNLGEGYLKEYEARVAAEAAADEESAREDAELEELEEAEALARDE
mmetsp:Transcript_35568/g.107115  ORF Transcript_35568/g.107115 Transcript_35568/m.107115 type:complete len:127 (+) Transcript_35568:4037-4417(+)